MIKLPLPLRHSAAVAVAFTALCGASLTAASVDNWTQYSGTPISDLNTSHPVIGDGTSGSISSHTMYSVTPTYKLEAVGDSLTFSGKANFQGMAYAQADQFRFGVYDSNGTTPGTGAANVSGWLGYFATNAGSNAGTDGTGDLRSRLWKRTEGNTSSFGSATGLGNNVAWAGASAPNPLLSGDYSFSMVLTKTDGGVNVTWTLIGLSQGSTYAISGNYNDANPNTLQFDRVGIFVAGSTGISGELLSFSELDLTFVPAVPEPATTALLAGVAVLGAVLLRRRSRR